MPRTPLPEELGPIFTVSSAKAAGVSESRLRSSDLDAPYRGVRVVRGAVALQHEPSAAMDAGELRRRALELASTMPPNQFFTHVTAAVLWGLPLPGGVLRDSNGLLRPLDVGVFAPLRHPRHAGVAGHQVRPGYAQIAWHGVPLVDPASAWATLGGIVFDEYDLVSIGDAAVREAMFRGDPPPLTTLERLSNAIAVGRRVGGPALRRAITRIRPRSASRMETRSRLILIDGGMPEPELNYLVQDQLGRVVACVDLAYPEKRVAVEYEGEHHLTDPRQWAKDIARHELLGELGWIIVRATKADVFHERAAFVRRVDRALRRR
jgi:very-short-patch-repair endonuclease